MGHETYGRSMTSKKGSKTKTLVVGAGIVGASIAYHLARRGAEVIIVDRVGPAAGASGKSYGLDGSVIPWINDANKYGDLNDASDHVYLYFGQRRGGSDIFSLDVSTLSNPKLE